MPTILRAIIKFYNKRQQQYKQIIQLKNNFIMIFIIKSSSKSYWSFKNNIKLIKNITNQFVHNLSNHFFKILILIIFKGIEANYLYVYKKNHLKN
jgi:PII-like signaling protein